MQGYMKIYVSTQEEKDEIIAQSEYVHYFMVQIRGRKGRAINWKGLDSDKAGLLMHLYTYPEGIIVDPEMAKNGFIV